MKVLNELETKGIQYEIVSEMQGKVASSTGEELKADQTFTTTDAVLYDGIYAVGGANVSKKFAKEAAKYIAEAFDHYKPIGATHDGMIWLEAAEMQNQPGIVAGENMTDFTDQFISAIAAHRHWERELN